MKIADLYRSIEQVNSKEITGSEFVKRVYGYIQKEVELSKAPDKEEMTQDIALYLLESVKRGNKFNPSFFKWRIQKEIERRTPQTTDLATLDSIYYDMDIDSIAIKMAVEHLKKCLTEREKLVIEKRFIYEMTLSEVGKEFGVNSERIRQIEVKALRKMRRLMYSMKELI